MKPQPGFFVFILVLLLGGGIWYWKTTGNTTQGTAIQPERGLVNTSGASGIALAGYDPVGFHTDGKPVHGDPEITANHNGAIYMFASHENKAMFEKTPEKFAPQYGGFSALGVSYGSLLPVDITTWKIVQGKLYLDLNPEYAEEFHADFEENVTSADKQWPELIEKNTSLTSQENE